MPKLTICILSLIYLPFASCKKKELNTPPAITNISPSSGRTGDQVIINGTNFSSTASANEVKFNGVAAIVTAATEGKITATVPVGATSGIITVSVSGKTASSPIVFTIMANESTYVYISGYRIETSMTIAKYWKNGSPVILSQNNSFTESATSVAVGGDSDVYVVGNLYEPPLSTMEYWKNGNLTSIHNNTLMNANSIAVSGNDVYAAGFISDSTLAHSTAVYWKNNSVYQLSAGAGVLFSAHAIAVDRSDVYVAWDYKCSNSNYIAKYSKNGVPVTLTDSSVNAHVTCIAVSGNDIYVGGFIDNLSNSSSMAVYWKNGNEVMLTDGTNTSTVTGMAISGNDVYFSGDEFNQGNTNPVAKYWKNGNAVVLGGGTVPSTTSGIAVAGNDVYVSGMENYYAKYWKNGISVDISNGSTLDRTTGIAVK